MNTLASGASGRKFLGITMCQMPAPLSTRLAPRIAKSKQLLALSGSVVFQHL
jgi:hypothetical protein